MKELMYHVGHGFQEVKYVNKMMDLGKEVIPQEGDRIIEPNWSWAAWNQDHDKKWNSQVKKALGKYGLTLDKNIVGVK